VQGKTSTERKDSKNQLSKASQHEALENLLPCKTTEGSSP